MPAGRPTLYTDTTPERVEEYLDTYSALGDVVPTVEGLALFLGVSRDTVYEWANDESKAAFSDTLKRLKLIQFQGLFNGSLKGELNTAVSKMALNANHGMIERKANEISGPGGKPVELSEIRRTIVDP